MERLGQCAEISAAESGFEPRPLDLLPCFCTSLHPLCRFSKVTGWGRIGERSRSGPIGTGLGPSRGWGH